MNCEFVSLNDQKVIKEESWTAYLILNTLDFCAKTEILKGSFSLGADVDPDDTTANKRYYTLPSEVLTIREVYLDNVRIPRLIGKPIIDDTTSEEM